MRFGPGPVLGAKDGTQEEDTFSPWVLFTVPPWKHPQHRWNSRRARWGCSLAWHRAMTLEVGDQGDELEIPGKAAHRGLSANAWPRTSVQGMLAIVIIVIHGKG